MHSSLLETAADTLQRREVPSQRRGLIRGDDESECSTDATGVEDRHRDRTRSTTLLFHGDGIAFFGNGIELSRQDTGIDDRCRVVTTQTQQKPARSRRGTGSYDERRIKLAESALRTLGELGYARTSLRDIAANSEFSHGVVHYYFRDKTELIVFCVRHYKTQCMHRYDSVVGESTTAAELLIGFADKLVQTLTAEPSMHRLWYDLRSQSMFQEVLRDDVHDIDRGLEDMIWHIVSRYAELSSARPMVESRAAYSMFDGIFETALRDFLADRPGAVDWIRSQVTSVLPALCAPVESFTG